MYNKAVGNYNHSLGAFGARLNLRYIPQNSTFYPSLAINATTIRLPLVKLSDVVVSMRFTQINASIGVNRHKQLRNAQLHYGLGLGISYLDGKGIELSGKTENKAPYAPPPYIDAFMPSANISAEYTVPISSEVPLYVGLGANLQYMYFFDIGRTYTSTIVDTQAGAIPVHTNLQGQLVNPGLYILIYYRFRNNSNY